MAANNIKTVGAAVMTARENWNFSNFLIRIIWNQVL